MKLFSWLNKYQVPKYWVPAYACMSAILYLSLTPTPPDSVGGYVLNFNFLHLAAYFVLCLLISNAFANTRIDSLRKNPFVVTIFFCFLFGGLIEILQSFVPGRSPSMSDVFYNTSAIILYPLSITIFKNIKSE